MSETTVDWWRRPQALIAWACIAAGIGILAFGSHISAPNSPAPAPVMQSSGLLTAPSPVLPLATERAQVAAEMAPATDEVVVYVSGAVQAPDVYVLPADARVKDVVLAAGGLTPEAAAAAINLAAPLADAQHIHVPSSTEAAAAPTGAAAAGVAGDTRIDLNRASAADLEALPGIGAAIAARIVAYRDENGAFAAVADLQNVSGIGPNLFDQIKDLVTINP